MKRTLPSITLVFSLVLLMMLSVTVTAQQRGILKKQAVKESEASPKAINNKGASGKGAEAAGNKAKPTGAHITERQKGNVKQLQADL